METALSDLCADALIRHRMDDGALHSEPTVRWEAEMALARIFGVEHNFFRRVFLRRGRSEPMSKDDIARVLVANRIVPDISNGRFYAEQVLRTGIGHTRFVPYETRQGTHFRLEYKGQMYIDHTD